MRGARSTEWAQPRELAQISKSLSKRSFGPATAKYRELGTAANLLIFNRFGALPTRNFQSGSFEEAASLSPEQLSATRSKTRESCVACTIGCEHIYSNGTSGVRVEYESLFALGSLCGVGDAGKVLQATQRCDELGIDTISAGGTIALAAPRVATRNTHGTGCSLSSAIAAGLAKGEELEQVVRNAKAWISAAIASADRFSVGHGHGPIHHFHSFY